MPTRCGTGCCDQCGARSITDHTRRSTHGLLFWLHHACCPVRHVLRCVMYFFYALGQSSRFSPIFLAITLGGHKPTSTIMASTSTSQSLREQRAARTRLRQKQIRMANILKLYDRLPPPPHDYRSYQRHELYGPSDIPTWFCSSICLSPHPELSLSGCQENSNFLLAGKVECEVKLVRLPVSFIFSGQDIFEV